MKIHNKKTFKGRYSGFVLIVLASAMMAGATAHAQETSADFSAGSVKIGFSSSTCDASLEGAIRYHSANACVELCDGSSWGCTDGGVGSTCVSDGLVAHWKLDETSGTTAADSAGTNDGTLVNLDFATNGIAGKLGNALNFSGNTTVIPTADIDYEINTAISVAAWVRFTGCTEASNACYIVSKAEFDVQPYHLRVTSGTTIRFVVNSAGVSASSTQNDGNWHHAVGTFDGATCRLYVDGVSQGTATCTPVSNDILTTIGGTNVNQNYRNFQGDIDDVRIYHRVLTSQDVSDLYNSGAGCQ